MRESSAKTVDAAGWGIVKSPTLFHVMMGNVGEHIRDGIQCSYRGLGPFLAKILHSRERQLRQYLSMQGEEDPRGNQEITKHQLKSRSLPLGARDHATADLPVPLRTLVQD